MPAKGYYRKKRCFYVRKNFGVLKKLRGAKRRIFGCYMRGASLRVVFGIFAARGV